MNEQQTKPTLSSHAVRRLTLSRYYLSLAKEHARVDREADAFVAINLLHEALETFLVAASDHLNLSIKTRTEFATYLDKLDETLAPRRLPFRTTLIRINKARVNAKHDSIVPDRAEIPTFVASTESFLEEATEIVFALAFSAVSIVDLLNEGEVKEHLRAAQAALEQQSFADVLIESRKALYLTFEKQFDVSPYAAEDNPAPWLTLSCEAPSYARSKKYIEERVLEPFDFIVRDHARLDSDLVKDGLDPLIFWNLWRLTPEVYKNASGEWLVKHDLNKVDADAAKENASYVLENTVNLLHQRERKRRAVRTANRRTWQVGVKNKGANVYKKSSRTSAIVSTVPEELEQLEVESATPALDGDGYFWRVSHVVGLEFDKWIIGYVHEDDLLFRK